MEKTSVEWDVDIFSTDYDRSSRQIFISSSNLVAPIFFFFFVDKHLVFPPFFFVSLSSLLLLLFCRVGSFDFRDGVFGEGRL